MRVRPLVAVAATLALAVPAAVAQAGSATDRATGGGQTLVDSQGAGNTIAFTAQGTPELAKGQVQYIDRTAGTGQAQEKFHGIVRCLRVEGNMAEIGGVERTRDGSAGQPFNLLVIDNGEGAAAEDDVIQFNDDVNDVNCDDGDSDDDTPDFALARGNAQVYDAP